MCNLPIHLRSNLRFLAVHGLLMCFASSVYGGRCVVCKGRCNRISPFPNIIRGDASFECSLSRWGLDRYHFVLTRYTVIFARPRQVFEEGKAGHHLVVLRVTAEP